MTEYEKGYIDGVNALLKKIQNYYNTLGGQTPTPPRHTQRRSQKAF